MIDVFVSYKREEQAIAKKLVDALKTRGYQVWWDQNLLPGAEYIHETNAILQQASAVIVLWSKLSINSNWVIAEANAAQSQRKLLPISIDSLQATDLPAPFNVIHTYQFDSQQVQPDAALMSSLIQAIDRIKAKQNADPQDEVRSNKSIDEVQQEVEFWKSISSSARQSSEEYQRYIERYGRQAIFYQLAQTRLAVLEETELRPAEVRARQKNILWLLLGAACTYCVVAFWFASQSHTIGIPLPLQIRPGSNLVAIFALPITYLLFIPFLHLSRQMLEEYPHAKIARLIFPYQFIMNIKNKFDFRLLFIVAAVFFTLPMAGIIHLENKMLSGRAAISFEQSQKLKDRNKPIDEEICTRVDDQYGCVIAENWHQHLLSAGAIALPFWGDTNNAVKYDPDDCNVTSLNCKGVSFFPFIQPWLYLLIALYTFRLWLNVGLTAIALYGNRGLQNV